MPAKPETCTSGYDGWPYCTSPTAEETYGQVPTQRACSDVTLETQGDQSVAQGQVIFITTNDDGTDMPAANQDPQFYQLENARPPSQ